LSHYFVVFRAHDATESLHSKPRPGDLPKATLLRICFLSLLDALKAVPHRLHVLGDNLSDESLRFFRGFDVTLTNEPLGPHGSMRRALEVACTADDEEWVYLAEDDYLHRAECFEWIDELLAGRTKYLACDPKLWWKRPLFGGLERHPLFIYPADAPVFYGPRRLRHSLIFQSRFCHWRQIDSTPFSFLTQGRELKRRRHLLDPGAGDRKIDARTRNRKLFARYVFWRKALCIAPIPGLANHLHVGTMAEIGGWEERLAHYRERVVGPR
jgi:hypothetical protein